MYDLSIILLFFINGFKFQNFASNGCQDLTVLSLNIRNIALSLLKLLILFVLFMALANLKQLFVWKFSA